MSACSRRSFLKLSGVTVGGAVLPGLFPEDQPPPHFLARATAFNIDVREQADPEAPVIKKLNRDQIVTALEEVVAENGPAGNPRWFRLLKGYAHTACLQEVRYDFNTVVYDVPSGGMLTEVTVPYTQSYHGPTAKAEPLYRLYYKAVFWVTGTTMDADGRPWYTILDDRLHNKYYARAEHLRRFTPDELAPLSPEVPPESKRIEVDLTKQTVTAFEYDKPVFHVTVSGGWLRKDPKPGQSRTVTPVGRFRVFEKTPSRHMGNGRLTSDLDAYELPGVPFVSFFHILGTAFHGAYWHNDFGRPNSQGCLNMRPDDARWLYRWIYPTVEWEMDPPQFVGEGTEVYLHD
jgi:lipoprotein-anchoring transpeptidase ErfK/SrfK